ncbi:MAG: hypothetical protein KF851_05285 [Pirellulaceae bacterium]|jgi:hypothetical protein|nr:hypothetical protein [Pirellulaceae bacterium]
MHANLAKFDILAMCVSWNPTEKLAPKEKLQVTGTLKYLNASDSHRYGYTQLYIGREIHQWEPNYGTNQLRLGAEVMRVYGNSKD